MIRKLVLAAIPELLRSFCLAWEVEGIQPDRAARNVANIWSQVRISHRIVPQPGVSEPADDPAHPPQGTPKISAHTAPCTATHHRSPHRQHSSFPFFEKSPLFLPQEADFEFHTPSEEVIAWEGPTRASFGIRWYQSSLPSPPRPVGSPADLTTPPVFTDRSRRALRLWICKYFKGQTCWWDVFRKE